MARKNNKNRRIENSGGITQITRKIFPFFFFFVLFCYSIIMNLDYSINMWNNKESKTKNKKVGEINLLSMSKSTNCNGFFFLFLWFHFIFQLVFLFNLSSFKANYLCTFSNWMKQKIFFFFSEHCTSLFKNLCFFFFYCAILSPNLHHLSIIIWYTTYYVLYEK